MAYRRLGAVAFAVLGWVTVGCGSGPAGTVSTGLDDEAAAPLNPDQPPRNAADQPPKNAADTPPRNAADTPSNSSVPPSEEQPGQPGGPGKPPPPGGGNLGQLCRRLCDRLDDCPDTDSGCEADECSFSPSEEAAIAPCRSQISALYNCALNLPDVCGELGAQCAPYLDAFTQCLQANGIDDLGEEPTTNPPPAPPPPPAPGGMCTMANGCQCATACQLCTCYGGTATQCAEACAVTP